MNFITAPLGEKAQITLPKVIRETLNIKNSGDLVGFIIEGKTIKLTKAHVIPEMYEFSDEEAKKLAHLARKKKGHRFKNAETALRYLWGL